MNADHMYQLARRAIAANLAAVLIGAFFVSYLGGPLAGLAAVLMAAAVTAAAAIAGGAVALRCALQRAANRGEA